MKGILKAIVCLAIVFVSCDGGRINHENLPHGRIKVKGQMFIDEQNREIIFNGINIVNKSPSNSFPNPVDEALLAKLKSWGINLVRLGINWSALEPEPLQYDIDYIENVGKVVALLGSHGIYVMLDMHQDLYGHKFDNGAPEWATLDDDLPHITGEIWSDAYIISPAVQKSFDSFWENREVPGGIGLQDHYARAWAQVAEYFSGNEMVVGYDILNEPVIGSDAAVIFDELVNGLGLIYYEETGIELSPEDAIEIWSDQDKRSEILRYIDNADMYAKWLIGAEPIHQKFDIEKLQPFYQRVANSIREKDKDGILFLEHGYFSNLGMRTKITGVKRPDGSPDPQCAYAPHAYDLVVDTRASDNPGYERLGLIFARLNNTKKDLNMPVLLGEWGAFYGGEDENMVAVADFNVSQIDKYGFSHAYWSYYGGLEKQPYMYRSIIRPVPRAVPGQIVDYGFNDAGNYLLTYAQDASSQAPAIVFLPGNYQINTIECSIIAKPEFRLLNKEAGSLLYIKPTGKSGARTIGIALN